MTIGESMAWIMAILATATTLWAAIIAVTLLFPERVRRAAVTIETKTGATLGRGAAVAFVGIGLGIAMLNAGPGPVKFLGFALLAITWFAAVLGSAGIARIAGERLRGEDRRRSAFAANARGAAFLVAAGFLPGLGWFLLAPLQLFAGVGAGIAALGKERSSVAVPFSEIF